MIAKLSLVLAAVAALTSAVPTESTVGEFNAATGNCNVGKLNCCNNAQKAQEQQASNQLGLLGIALGSVTGLVGLQCNPITVIGAGGASCNAQPVCCTNNSFQGLIALGCSPVNINL